MAIDWEVAAAGAEVFKLGDTSGVPRETRDSIERTGVALKGPLETPVGFGEKSANVTLRKLFETYANIRPARQIPGVPTRYDGEGVDFIVVRENIEDLYAGVEYDNTRDVSVAFKIISRRGSEKILRYAFELAEREGRTKVTCATKANILKHTEGMFKAIFEELAPEYPDITPEHLIIDNVAHQMAKNPAQFDVIVTTNLAGDIISDLASGLVGGLGFAASGNYGDGAAIFEAVHGSAPKYAGKNVINPTALILSSVMMLRHLGEDGRRPAGRGRRLRDPRGGQVDDPRRRARRRRRGAVDLDLGLHGRGHRQPGPRTVGALPDQGGRAHRAPCRRPGQRWATGAARAIETVVHGVDIYVESRPGAERPRPSAGDRWPDPSSGCSSSRPAARWSTPRRAARWTTSAGGAAGSSRPRTAASVDDAAIGQLLARVACQGAPGSRSRSCASTVARKASPAPRASRSRARQSASTAAIARQAGSRLRCGDARHVHPAAAHDVDRVLLLEPPHLVRGQAQQREHAPLVEQA